MPEQAAIGIDIGGTKIAVGGVFHDGRLIELTRLPTRGTTLAELAAVAAGVAGRLEGRAEIAGVGVGICELVDADGQVGSAASVPWTAAALAEALDALGPVTIEADVRAAALAEARFGAGRPFATFLYLTIGTGISHCLVQNGEPYRGAHGHAQLSGSAPLSFRCPHCGELVRLSAEDVASGAALTGSGAEVEHATQTLGSLLALLVNVLDPEAVVVGGGLGSAEGAYWDGLVGATRAHIWSEAARELPIVQAGLGASSGVIGAGWTGLRAAELQLGRRRA
jgi:glucokinase